MDARDIAGQTCLFHALMHHERLDIAEVLVTKGGANVNLQDRMGCVAMTYCIMNGTEASVKFLVDHGAKATIR